MTLILFNLQTKKLILRACVRAGENLTSSLPQGGVAFFLVTDTSWRNFDELFGENTDTRKVRTVLSSSPKQGTISKLFASTNHFSQHEVQAPFLKQKAWWTFFSNVPAIYNYQ
jgi:hypothetical protein